MVRPRNALLALLLAVGCARGPGAEATLDAYVDALRLGQIERAYRLTTPRFRATHDLASFAMLAARQPLVDRAERARGATELVVSLSGKHGAIRLVARGRGGPLRVVDDPTELFPRATPEQALASFARAIAIEVPERALALLSPSARFRAAWLPALTKPPAPIIELAELIDRTLQTSAPAIVIDAAGNARWLVGAGRAISLVRSPDEGGGWVIDAF